MGNYGYFHHALIMVERLISAFNIHLPDQFNFPDDRKISKNKPVYLFKLAIILNMFYLNLASSIVMP